MKYEIQNYLGERIYEVSQEELNSLLEKASEEKINYFQFDKDNDLVTKWDSEKETRDVVNFRIYKQLGV
jgi:hypothetical protein